MTKCLLIPLCLFVNVVCGQGKFFGGSGDGFTVNQISVILPLKIVSFDVTLRHDHAYLEWTAYASDIPFFIIEISEDGILFNKLAEKVTISNSNIAARYSYNDIRRSGTWYYRLKWTEINGQVKYSKIIAISVSGKETVRAYYDAATDLIRIINQPANSIIELLSADGKLQKRITGNTANVQVAVYDLPAGTYFIRITNGSAGKVIITRFTKPGNH